MKIEIEISRDVIEDIFVTALESGIDYWYFLSDDTIERIRAAVPKEVDPYFSTAIVKAVLDHNVEVNLCDLEDEDEGDVIGTISVSTMGDRLRALLLSDERDALLNFINETADAGDADIVFQHLAMGEVVYG